MQAFLKATNLDSAHLQALSQVPYSGMLSRMPLKSDNTVRGCAGLCRCSADVAGLDDVEIEPCHSTVAHNPTTLWPAMQKFVSGLLGVADDMERALESVPADVQQHKDPAALLQGLRGGIALTHKTLEKVTHLRASTFSARMPRRHTAG